MVSNVIAIEPTKTSKRLGFTLIELVITMAIISILSAIAIPSYLNYINDSRRAEAVAFALDIASRQRHYFTENRKFTDSMTTGLKFGDDKSENDYWQATITLGGSGATYSLVIAPVAPHTDSECSTFNLTNTGLKTHTGSAAAAKDCWK